jgi:murein DD-endopeptidase MepM/ murein hydrolase activator NlpD
VGVPVQDERYQGQGGGDGDAELSAAEQLDAEEARRLAVTTRGARYVYGLEARATGVAGQASERSESLEDLLAQLEDKRVKLVSMPSIWPARGWLTSRFGARISPFTGRTQMHRGIDIAGREGTPIVAPARGRVSFVGNKGPLGNSLTVDHGFGVRTVYGHTHAIFVKSGQEVERGQTIASIGSSGRSTGPHLHYSVEIKGKARDPLDYVFD